MDRIDSDDLDFYDDNDESCGTSITRCPICDSAWRSCDSEPDMCPACGSYLET